MTLEQHIRKLLFEHDLWPEKHVDVVIIRAKIEIESMEHRWNDNTEGYPPEFLPSLWIRVKAIALEYIDETIPKAFYRDMFVD